MACVLNDNVFSVKIYVSFGPLILIWVLLAIILKYLQCLNPIHVLFQPWKQCSMGAFNVVAFIYCN